MVVLTAETCWALNEYWINNKISGIKLVSLYSTIKIIFTNFMIKSMCLWKPWKTHAKEEGSVNHHLNTRGFDESNLCPPWPPTPIAHFPWDERDLFLFASYTYASTSRLPPAPPPTLCSIFWKTGQCMSPVRPCLCNMSYKDTNFSWFGFAQCCVQIAINLLQVS